MPPFATTGAVPGPFLTTTAGIIAITVTPVHACDRCALSQLSGNGGDSVRNRAPLDQKQSEKSVTKLRAMQHTAT